MTIQFNFNGHQFTVNRPIGAATTIDVIESSGDIIHYSLREPRPSKHLQTVYVDYVQELRNRKGDILDSKLLHFNATTQESFAYFLLMVSPIALGDKLDTMCIDGLLYEKYGFFIYDALAQFFQPIWFETAVEDIYTPIDREVITEEGETVIITEQVLTGGNLTINVIDGAGDTYTYKLVGTDIPAQESNIFLGLEPGEYEVRVTSPLSMPYTRKVTILGATETAYDFPMVA